MEERNRELVVLPRCTLQERKSFCQLWVFNSLPNRFLRTFWWSPCLFMWVLSSGNHAIPGIGNLLADRPSQPSFFYFQYRCGIQNDAGTWRCVLTLHLKCSGASIPPAVKQRNFECSSWQDVLTSDVEIAQIPLTNFRNSSQKARWCLCVLWFTKQGIACCRLILIDSQ